MYSLAT